MLVAAVAAIAWANSPWQHAYHDLWATPLSIELGNLVHIDHLSLQDWVNDALMAIFFLLVGAEIKREVVHGDLRDARARRLPVIAAAGGMIVPALIFIAFNAGGSGAKGWGVPMATDIAFAVGVVTLLGPRVPTSAKVFLLTFAVVDDIGAIAVIAVFYTGTVAWGWLAAALVGLGVIVMLRRSDIVSLVPYLVVGAFIWFALLESGVHATLAGVALGLLTPAWPLRSPARFPAAVRPLLDRVDQSAEDDILTEAELAEDEHLTTEIARLARYATSPVDRLERALTPWVTLAIVPLFALANAGVTVSGDGVAGLATDPVVVGVVVGLVFGKTIGIFVASALAVKLGVGQLPAGTTWRHVFGLAVCGGIGFTVALFVAGLAFVDPALTDSAKIGILAGSLIAGVAGFSILRVTSRTSDSGPVFARTQV